jgi:hypothetical protein
MVPVELLVWQIDHWPFRKQKTNRWGWGMSFFSSRLSPSTLSSKNPRHRNDRPAPIGLSYTTGMQGSPRIPNRTVNSTWSDVGKTCGETLSEARAR